MSTKKKREGSKEIILSIQDIKEKSYISKPIKTGTSDAGEYIGLYMYVIKQAQNSLQLGKHTGKIVYFSWNL